MTTNIFLAAITFILLFGFLAVLLLLIEIRDALAAWHGRENVDHKLDGVG